MLSALAAWHSALLNLALAAVWAALVVGGVPPLAILMYSFAIASYRPSAGAVSGGIPLAARMRVGVTLVRPCCCAAASADA